MATTVLPNSADTTASVLTGTGTRDHVVVVLSPSLPYSLLPQAATVPSEHSARLCALPVATATTVLPESAETPDTVFTATGTNLLVVVLSPSCPKPLAPQPTTVPSEHRAMLWAPPAAMATTVLPKREETPDATLTNTGTLRFTVVLSPS